MEDLKATNLVDLHSKLKVRSRNALAMIQDKYVHPDMPLGITTLLLKHTAKKFGYKNHVELQLGIKELLKFNVIELREDGYYLNQQFIKLQSWKY